MAPSGSRRKGTRRRRSPSEIPQGEDPPGAASGYEGSTSDDSTESDEGLSGQSAAPPPARREQSGPDTQTGSSAPRSSDGSLDRFSDVLGSNGWDPSWGERGPDSDASNDQMTAYLLAMTYEQQQQQHGGGGEAGPSTAAAAAAAKKRPARSPSYRSEDPAQSASSPAPSSPSGGWGSEQTDGGPHSSGYSGDDDASRAAVPIGDGRRLTTEQRREVERRARIREGKQPRR